MTAREHAVRALEAERAPALHADPLGERINGLIRRVEHLYAGMRDEIEKRGGRVPRSIEEEDLRRRLS